MSDTFDDLMYECKSALRLGGTIDHDADMEIYINEAVRHIDSLDIFEDQSCVIDIEDNKVRLPDGFAHFIGLRFVELTEAARSLNEDAVPPAAPLPQLFYDMVYLDFKWMMDCGIPDNSLRDTRMRAYETVLKIRGRYIIFNNNISGTYSKAQLVYAGLAKDDMGRNVIHDDFKRAIKAYVCYRFAQVYEDRYSAAFRTEHNAEWTSQKKWLKGKSQEESANRNKWNINRIMTRLHVNTI